MMKKYRIRASQTVYESADFVFETNETEEEILKSGTDWLADEEWVFDEVYEREIVDIQLIEDDNGKDVS
jgi:hypothetical protein